MKTRNIVTCVGALCACLAIASPAVAKDNCSGHTIGVGNARVVIPDDRTSPTYLATGECTGTGATTSTCTHKDKDGDEWTDVNEWVSGSFEGKWRSVGGTGKYAKNTSSQGSWKMVRSDPVNIWAWRGYCPPAAKKK